MKKEDVTEATPQVTPEVAPEVKGILNVINGDHFRGVLQEIQY